MKPIRFGTSLLATVSLASSGLSLHAASVTWDITPGSIGAGDSAITGGTGIWDTISGNWTTDGGLNNVAWVNASNDGAIFGGTAGTVTLGSAVTANSLTFNTIGYSVTGSTLTLAGTTPTIAANTDASIASALAGTVGLVKTGAGTLTLTGVNTYSGATAVNGGVLTFGGASSKPAGLGGLTVQNGAVLNLSSSGGIAFGNTSQNGPYLIGSTTSGAVNQTSGTVDISFANNTQYLQLGSGSLTAYGSYVLSGGTLNVSPTTGTSASGIRVAGNNGGATESAGVGVFTQTGGALTVGRFLSVGGGGASGPGTGIATFTGGTANIGSAGYRIIIGDRANSVGTVNIGTQAGGDAAVSIPTTGTAVVVGGNTGASAALNLNSGTLTIGAGSINRSNGTGVVNFNGGTVRAGATGLTLINNTLTSVNVYNGGAVFDTQAFATSTVSANLLKPSGNGVYVTGGTLAVGSGGSGYIGAPAVAVTGGTGSGAMAIANVSGGVLTGVTLTNPGQSYTVGDTLSFAFTGGGAGTPAGTFNYVLTASDIAANTSGGVTKLGTGSLTLSGASTYSGNTNVNAGTVVAGNASAFGAGNVVIASGATLNLNGLTVTNAIVNNGGTLTGANNYTGPQTLSGTSTYTGTVASTIGVNSGGTLQGTATFTGAVTVNSGGTAKGTGSLSGGLVINSGGTVSPGNSPGTLSAGNTVWNSGGNYVWEINNVAGTAGADPGWDLLAITGTLDLTGISNATPFVVKVTSLNLSNLAGNAVGFSVNTQSQSWVIASTTGGITNFAADKFSVDISSFSNDPTRGWAWSVQQTGNNLVLAYVPEPSTYAALAGLAGLGLALRRRRQAARRSAPSAL